VKYWLSKLVVGALAVAHLTACGSSDDADGSGSARFSVWGEEYIERGIPAELFADGWSVTYSKFLIVIGDIVVADERAGEAGRLGGNELFDLASAGPHAAGTLDSLPARTWNRVSYAVLGADQSTGLHSSATEDDLALMRQGGQSVHVTGVASRGDQRMTFAWGFSGSTRYSSCVAEVDGREVEGVAITNGGTEAVELTIHGDHLFYDDLASPEALPRFDAMAAADVNADDEVTLEELTAMRLVTIAAGSYGTGSASDVDDLGAFVRAQTGTLGHFRGEGHCVAQTE